MAVACAPRSRINSAAETTIRSRGLRICMMLYITLGPAKVPRPIDEQKQNRPTPRGNGRFCVCSAKPLGHPVAGSVVLLVVAAGRVLHHNGVTRAEVVEEPPGVGRA